MSAAASFLASVDRRHEAGDSVVRRYRNVLRSLGGCDGALADRLESTNIQEGVRVFRLLEHRGVEVDVLDESSRMHTHTLKSVDGSVTAAHCLLRGHRRVVFESGGNTATALTRYGIHAGLETFCFVPARNLPWLDSRAFASPSAHLIAVEDAQRVKDVTRAFAARHELPLVPETAWRYQASMLVGCFVLEHMLANGGYDVVMQSISAAFGPIGIYRVLGAHRESLGKLPIFLGVQQASNCPMVRAWRASSDGGGSAPPRTDLLAQVMYDREPQRYGTFDELRDILVETSGDLTTIDHDDYRAYLGVAGRSLLDLLADHDVRIACRNGDVLEKAGLLALAGALREIETGRIRRGGRILVCLTGGAAQPDGLARPECRVGAEGESADALALALAEVAGAGRG